jgi:hypothetical protein
VIDWLHLITSTASVVYMEAIVVILITYLAWILS